METLSSEQQENRRLWIEALRSKKYQQGKNYLKRQIDGEIVHCCLGVYCEIKKLNSNIPPSENENFPSHPIFHFTSLKHPGAVFIEFLPSDLKDSLGLTQKTMYQLVEYNDDCAKNFEEIADIIERGEV